MALEGENVASDADARVEFGDHAHAKDLVNPPEPSEPRATGVSAAPPQAIPQNVEDLRVGYPLLAPIIEANERAIGGEDKDPLWSTEMETRIVNEISRKALGLEITELQVDCRTTLCRVEMTFSLQFLQRKFEPFTPDTVWNGRQPVMFFIKALDLDFHQQVAAGLNGYGTPVLVGYVAKPPEKTSE